MLGSSSNTLKTRNCSLESKKNLNHKIGWIVQLSGDNDMIQMLTNMHKHPPII